MKIGKGIYYSIIMAAMGFFPLRAQNNYLRDTTPVEVKYKYYFAEGLRNKLAGNSEEAKDWFTKCIELVPDSAAGYYELGQLYAGKKDYATAAGYARNAWKKDNRNKWYGLLLIDVLQSLGKPDECALIYKDLLKIESDNVDFRIGEIIMLIQAEQYKEAIGRIDKLPKDDDLEKWGMIRKKEIYFNEKKYKDGIKVLDKWLEKNPADVEVRGLLADALSEIGKKDEAEKNYGMMKSQDPDNPEVCFQVGMYYYQSNRKVEAEKEFITGFKSDRVRPEIKIEIIKSIINEEKDQPSLSENVAKLIRVLYEVDGGMPIVDEIYANYLYSITKNDEAEVLYKKLIKTDPGNFMNWQNLLFILNEKRNYPEIEAVSDSAIQYYPQQGLFYLFKGIAQTELKKYEKAREALNKGMSIPGQNSEVIKQFYMTMAEASYKNGQEDEAFGYFDQIIALEPENLVALNNYSYYLSLKAKNLDKAKEMIEICVRKEPENHTYLDTYAWVLFMRKEFQKALEPIEKAVRFSKDPTGEVIEHYGDILFMNGKPDEARLQWNLAKSKEGASSQIEEKIKNGLTK